MRLRILSALLLSLVLAGPVSAGPAPDFDSDGFPNAEDNCLLVPQTLNTFCDTDMDGYGNLCDGDLNNDTVVAGLDFDTPNAPDFLDCFRAGSDPSQVGCDLNCDGVVNGLDFNAPGPANDFLDFFVGGIGPGPSGLSCAGTVPCE